MCEGENRQASVEVTPEMIRAGMLELSGYDPMAESGADAVRRVYTAMHEAQAVMADRLSCCGGYVVSGFECHLCSCPIYGQGAETLAEIQSRHHDMVHGPGAGRPLSKRMKVIAEEDASDG